MSDLTFNTSSGFRKLKPQNNLQQIRKNFRIFVVWLALGQVYLLSVIREEIGSKSWSSMMSSVYMNNRSLILEAEESELRNGLKKALKHFVHIQKEWNDYVDSNHPNIPYLDCSLAIQKIEENLGISREEWSKIVRWPSAHFSKVARFGTIGSCHLYDTSVRTIIDLLDAMSDDESSVVMIKPPQSGVTTTLAFFGIAYRALNIIKRTPVRWLSCYPNDNSLEAQAKTALHAISKLYCETEIKLGRILLNSVQDVLEEPGDASCFEVHKTGPHCVAKFYRKVAGGELISNKEGEEIAKTLVSTGIPIVISIDEAQKGSGKNQVMGKQLLTVYNALEPNQRNLIRYVVASATGYEVVHTDFAKKVKRVPCWVGETYSGPPLFEGYKIKVVGDCSKVKPPKLRTFDEQFGLKEKFGISSVDYTISQKYGKGSVKTRLKKLIEAEYGVSDTELKNTRPEDYAQAEKDLKRYDDYLEEVVPYCINKALEQQAAEGHEICGVAIRVLNNNSIAHKLVDSWNLSKDIKVIKCFDNENLSADSAKKLNPAELAAIAIKEGYKKFLIIHTGGGRMGVQFPVECRIFMETTSCTDQTDPLIQAYHGRGCGHGKDSTYVGNASNVEHLRHFYETGYSPKKKPSRRSVRHHKMQSDTYGWFMRDFLPLSIVKKLDQEVGDKVLGKLLEINMTPNEFYQQWIDERNGKKKNLSKFHRTVSIKSTPKFSDAVIRTIAPLWDMVDKNSELVCDLRGNLYDQVRPLKMAKTLDEQIEIIEQAASGEPVHKGFISESGKVAGTTIGLRYWPKSLQDASIIDVGSSTDYGDYDSGDTTLKGKHNTINYQLVWDFDDDGAARFVALKFPFIGEAVKNVADNPVHAADTSMYHEMHAKKSESFGADGHYESVGITKANIIVNGSIKVLAGSTMSRELAKTCPSGAKHLRQQFLNGLVKLDRSRNVYVFPQDVIVESASLHILGSAIHGSNRSAERSWRFSNV